MPAKLLMTWVPRTKRWAKNYLGKSYSVSCRQLGVPATKEASWQAANAWWSARQAELKQLPPPDATTANVARLLGERRLALAVDEDAEALENIVLLLQGFRGERLSTMAEINAAAKALVEANRTSPMPQGFAAGVIGEDRARQIDQQLPGILHGKGTGDRTVGSQVAGWLDVLQAAVAGGQMDPARYDSYRGNVTIFRDWVGAGQTVEVITSAKLEQFHAYLLRQIGARREWERSLTPPGKDEKKPGYAPAYAHSVFGTVKRFVTRLADHGLIPLPANIKGLRLEKGRKKVETFQAEELKNLLAACSSEAPKTGLYLLLMMNCGMYQSDISDLGRDELDLDKGIITRPRSKTPNGPVVRYKLWPETLQLLRRFASKETNVLNARGVSRVLLTEKGKPLVPSALVDGGRLARTDNVKSAYRRLLDRLKINQAKPLKLIRKTSATLLGHHHLYKFYEQYFLAHSPRSVADAHYVIPSDTEFFEALDWLRGQYGLGGTG